MTRAKSLHSFHSFVDQKSMLIILQASASQPFAEWSAPICCKEFYPHFQSKI